MDATSRKIINSDENFQMCSSTKENKLHINEKFEQKAAFQTATDYAEEMLNENGARLETSPYKSLKELAQQVGVSVSLSRSATKLQHLHLYKTTVIENNLHCRWQRKLDFVNWCLLRCMLEKLTSHSFFTS